MPNDPQKFIDEMIHAAKKREDLSVWLKYPEAAESVNVINKLLSVPRRSVNLPDLAKIQARVLDKIEQRKAESPSLWQSIPGFMKASVAVLGSLMITVSLTMGLAVAALQSVPGQAIYPLKKIVENIELRLTPDSKVAALQIQFADNRLNELQTVIDKHDQGEISEQEVQEIVSATVKAIQQTTAAAAKSTAQQPQSVIVSKLAGISNRLKVASIETSGEVKIEIEKALQSTQDSKAEALKNIQQAGIEVEGEAIVLEDVVTASGKLTAASETSVSIGNVKFLITKETKFAGLTIKDLKAGITVDISGQIKDNKSYAEEIKLIESPKPEETPVPADEQPTDTTPETTEPTTTQESQ